MKKRIVPMHDRRLVATVGSPRRCFLSDAAQEGEGWSPPAYWFEGNKVYFYVSGGVAGIERKEIDKIENLKTEDGEYIIRPSAIDAKKELPPLTPAAEKKPNEPEKTLRGER